MSTFNFNDYQNAVTSAKNKTAFSDAPRQKVGFFRLKNDGDEALVRINVSKMEDLQFALVHKLRVNGKFMAVGCLNTIGSHSTNCELCAKAAEANSPVDQARKRVYIQMMVSYKNPITGTFDEAMPVVWERPAGFAQEVLTKLRNFGDLKKVLLHITRNGVAGSTDTTYSIDYAMPAVYKPELVPEDFSAFNGFDLAKHSFWEKSAEDIHIYVTTGNFPEVVKAATSEQVAQPQTQPAYAGGYVAPTYSAPVPQTAPAEEPKAEEPKKSFSNFSF